MTAPDYVAQVAELLREHRWDNETALCQCGLMVGLVCDGLTREQHQAEVLAAAGLIPTRTAQTYLNGRVVERGVTDWKGASDD